MRSGWMNRVTMFLLATAVALPAVGASSVSQVEAGPLAESRGSSGKRVHKGARRARTRRAAPKKKRAASRSKKRVRASSRGAERTRGAERVGRTKRVVTRRQADRPKRRQATERVERTRRRVDRGVPAARRERRVTNRPERVGRSRRRVVSRQRGAAVSSPTRGRVGRTRRPLRSRVVDRRRPALRDRRTTVIYRDRPALERTRVFYRDRPGPAARTRVIYRDRTRRTQFVRQAPARTEVHHHHHASASSTTQSGPRGGIRGRHRPTTYILGGVGASGLDAPQVSDEALPGIDFTVGIGAKPGVFGFELGGGVSGWRLDPADAVNTADLSMYSLTLDAKAGPRLSIFEPYVAAGIGGHALSDHVIGESTTGGSLRLGAGLDLRFGDMAVGIDYRRSFYSFSATETFSSGLDADVETLGLGLKFFF